MGPGKHCCPGGLSLVPGPPNILQKSKVKTKEFREGKDSPTALPGIPEGCGYFCMPAEQAAFYLGSQKVKTIENVTNGTAANGTAVNGTAANGTAANGTTANGTAANGTSATTTLVNLAKG